MASHPSYIAQWGSCCLLISVLNYLRYLGFATTRPGAPDWDDYIDTYRCRYGSVLRTEAVWADHGICCEPAYCNDPTPPFGIEHFDDTVGYHSSLVVETTRSGSWVVVNRSGKKRPLVQTVAPSLLTLRGAKELTYVGDWRL